MIEIGCIVEDVITGFRGTVTGIVDYITGCRQALVAPRSEDGKWVESTWIDEARLKLASIDRIALPGRPVPSISGPDKAPPVR